MLHRVWEGVALGVIAIVVALAMLVWAAWTLPAAAAEPGERAIWFGASRAKIWADGARVPRGAEVEIYRERGSRTWVWMRIGPRRTATGVEIERRLALVRSGDLHPMAARGFLCRFELPPGHPTCAR